MAPKRNAKRVVKVRNRNVGRSSAMEVKPLLDGKTRSPVGKFCGASLVYIAGVKSSQELLPGI